MIKDETQTRYPCEILHEETEENAVGRDNGLINENRTSDIPSRLYLQYDVNENPPFLLNLFLAVQNIVTAFGTALVVSFTIADITCADKDAEIRSKIFCTSLFLIGLSTILQTTFGIRLPIFQGTSGAFLGPLISMKTADIWSCEESANNRSEFQNVSGKFTQDLVFHRITELQGSLMLSGLITEVFLGATGCLGFMAKCVGPITVCVTITSLGLGMYPLTIRFAVSHIPVAFSGVIVMVICILFLDKIRVAIPQMEICRKRSRPVLPEAKTQTGLPIFRTFSIILTMAITWSLCAVLTIAGVFPEDPKDLAYRARTDTRWDVVRLSPWIFFPYPGQFGPIRFNTAIFIGFICSYLTSSVESIGDYMAIARATGTYPPPRHAFNRGILVEGLMGVLAGALGAGHATTSYSQNIVIIKITEVASRSVLILAGTLCMLFGIIGKFGAFMTSVPDPVVAAIAFIQFGLLTALGISALQHVDLTSTRNLAVIGVSIYVGVFASEWLKINSDKINTGSPTCDQILKLILGTPMFLAAITSVVLDNAARGTTQERGMEELASINNMDSNQLARIRSVYDLPGVNRLQLKMTLFRKVPFLQPYREMDT